MIPFVDACHLVESLIAARPTIIDDAARARTLDGALGRLADGMRADAWRIDGRRLDLQAFVGAYDRLTRRDGFHVLHDWDGVADRVTDQTIPLDVLGYVRARRGGDPVDRRVLAIVLDYYAAHLLALMTLRIWDEGDADANLDVVDRLLAGLQSESGSGQPFAANAETLLLIGTSHFEIQEIGYEKLLARVGSLSAAHRANIALGHASTMGCHLRFGFEATYTRDTVKMRDDNVADYPWLCFALATAMEEYERRRASGASVDAVVEALLNGLSADARAFVGEPPPSLARSREARGAFFEAFQRHRSALVDAFARFRPRETGYSPLALFFNFSHNVVKGMVVDALLRGRPWPFTLNDLLMAHEPSAPNLENPENLENLENLENPENPENPESLARLLMRYARQNPSRIGGRLMPVIVYDPQAGRRAFAITMEKLAATEASRTSQT